MKIDEASINNTAMKLIEDEANRIWDILGEGKEKQTIESMAYINGIAMMAKYMKEVLKS